MAAAPGMPSKGSGVSELAFAGVVDADPLARYSAPPGRAPPDGAEQRHFDELSVADFVRVANKA
eukprot:11925305-Alexandrium_andersonii.AAC.1